MRVTEGRKAEVGHVIRLVDDGHLDGAERAGGAVEQVDQPSRGGDDDVNATG